MDQKKVEKVIGKTLDFLAEVLDEKRDENARKSEVSQNEENATSIESGRVAGLFEMEK